MTKHQKTPFGVWIRSIGLETAVEDSKYSIKLRFSGDVEVDFDETTEQVLLG
jgi:hypothetical protein